MTEAERKAQWADPYIRMLLMDLKASILTRYLHQDSPRKKKKISSSSEDAYRIRDVSAAG